MELPFTPDQFFSIFAEYNRGFWPVVVALWTATVAALLLTWRDPHRWSAALSFFLGALWFWNAAAYHAVLFTRINPAAWMFAALFAAQAVLFIRDGRTHRRVYFGAKGARQVLGTALAIYALGYPFLTMALGHEYPATPTYGVPCPTVILTIGLLLTRRDAVPSTLAVIPILWGFIGGSAAALLQVPTDYVLLAAGVFLLMLVASRPAWRSAVPRRG
jgi:hypothetical protein